MGYQTGGPQKYTGRPSARRNPLAPSSRPPGRSDCVPSVGIADAPCSILDVAVDESHKHLSITPA
eukprot:637742-Prymnesium_polylepis.2